MILPRHRSRWWLHALLAASLAAHAGCDAPGRTAERTVVMRWGDGVFGPAFYGALVYVDTLEPAYTVRARVYIGHGNSFFHDCGVLGTAKTWEDAVARWGTVEFLPDGLHIGTGPGAYFLPREQLEQHR